jgi:drug/metabolite transporter (DMT)-like permease
VRPSPQALLLFATFLWGSTFIVTKDIVAAGPPVAYLALRFGLATVVMLGIVALRRGRARWSPELWRDGAVLGVLNAAGLTMQAIGQVYTTASKSAFITSLNTPLTPVVALLLYRVRPSRVQLGAVYVATLGLLCLTYPGADARYNAGDLLSVGCAALYALFIVESARRMRRHDAVSMTLLQLGVGAVVFAMLWALERGVLERFPAAAVPELVRLEARALPLTGRTVWEIVYMAVGCGVLAVLVQTRALAQMTATAAAIVLALEPVFATGLALSVDGWTEWPGPRGALGAALVLCAIAVAQIRLPRPEPVE